MRLIDADALIENLQGSKVTTDSKDMDYKSMWHLLCTLVVETIEKAPTIEPSGDLISRQDAIEAVCCECEGEHYPRCSQQKYCREVNELLALPSADRPQGEDWDKYSEKLWHLAYERGQNDRPKGEWIDREDSADAFFLYKYECSVCGSKAVFNSAYCPNCGAIMKGGAE